MRRAVAIAIGLVVPASCALLDPFPDLAEPRADAGRGVDGSFEEDAGPIDGSGDGHLEPLCTPKATRPCGFEQCHGVERCTDEGAWEACSTPDASLERCDTAADESCDGFGGCTGEHRWATPLPTTGESHAWSVGISADGDVYAAGWFLGDMTLPAGGTLVQSGSPSIADGFVVKIARSGALLWMRRLADAPIQTVIVGKKDVVVTGSLLATSIAGECGSLVRQGATAFVVRYGFDGVCKQKRTLEGAATAIGAIDPTTDDVVLAGELVAPLALGGSPDSGADLLVPSTLPEDASGYFVRLGATLAAKNGAMFSSKMLTVHGIAANGLGHTTISGTFGSFLFLLEPKGQQSGYVATFNEKAEQIYGYRVGENNGVDPSALAYGRDGSLFIAGAYLGAIDLRTFNGPLLESVPGSIDGFVIQRSSLQPAEMSGRTFGRGGLERPRAIAVDSANGVVLAGYVNGDVSVGGDKFDAPGNVFFVAKYRATTFVTEWTKYFFTPDGPNFGNGVAVSPYGDVFVAGDHAAGIDFGAGPMDGGSGAFVVMRKP